MKQSKTFKRAENLVLHDKYNYNVNSMFCKELCEFLAKYAEFDSLVVDGIDKGDNVTITVTVKKFKKIILPPQA